MAKIAAVAKERVLIEDDVSNDLMADNRALPMGMARCLVDEIRRLLLERERGAA